MENDIQQQEQMIEPILQHPQIIHSDESFAKPNQIQVNLDEQAQQTYQNQPQLYQNQAPLQNQLSLPPYQQMPPYQNQQPPYQNPPLPPYQNPPLPPYQNQPPFQNQPVYQNQIVYQNQQPQSNQAPQPYQNQPPYQNGQQCQLVVMQPVSNLNPNQFQYSTSPVQFYCSKCQKTQISRTHPQVGDGTHIIAVALCFTTLLCCWIPYVVEGCQDVIHFCPDCKTDVGRKKFIDL